MRIWAISDTHTYHRQLVIPENIDMVIHAGDAGNSRDTQANYNELYDFYLWFEGLPIEHRVVVAGNHDVSIERGKFIPKMFDCVYLEHSYTIINGIKIFGSPYTPSFGFGWAFNKAPHKLATWWDMIPPDTDILVTHGPPKGILDLSYSPANALEYCGCNALRAKVKQIEPVYHIFGHIHDHPDGCYNAGVRTYNNYKTTYINASCVTDGKVGTLTHNGQVFELNSKPID